MYDPPKGQVANVERMLQVLALLRQSELGVPRTVLMEKVQGYAEKLAAGVKPDSVIKTMQLDVRALTETGFVIQDVAPEGSESVFRLRETSWRVPVDLSDFDKGLLAWVFRAAEAQDADAAPTTAPDAYDALIGSVPEALATIQAALAGGRAVVVTRNGEDHVLEPAQLVLHARRWMLLARYPGSDRAYGLRIDRLEDVRLGDALPVPPAPVEAMEVLDATYWDVDGTTVEVELRCDEPDLAHVSSWFPRAVVTADGEEQVLGFAARNTEAVLDRVVGLAGAARLAGPPSLVEALRQRLAPFVAAS